MSTTMNTVKKLKAIEMESRMLGMQNPLHNTNKGYAMLEKMGYKPGSSLGVNGHGIIEPIPVPVLRNFRQGLGVEADLQEKKKKKESQEKETALMCEQVSEKGEGKDLLISQISLDSAKGSEVQASKSQTMTASSLKKRQKKLARTANEAKLMEGSEFSSFAEFKSVSTCYRLVIKPTSFPAHKLSKNESEELHILLSHFIDNIPVDMKPKPQFDSFVFNEKLGVYMATCVGLHSNNWLRKIIPQISLNSGLLFDIDKLSAIYRQLECVNIGLFLPGKLPAKELVKKRLILHNPSLDIKQCKPTIINTKYEYAYINFAIPKNHITILRSLGSSLYYGFWKVNVFYLKPEDKPYIIPSYLEPHMTPNLFAAVPETKEQKSEFDLILSDLESICKAKRSGV